MGCTQSVVLVDNWTPEIKGDARSPKKNFRSTHDIEELLGEGAYSVVKAARHKQFDHKVAVKILIKHDMDEYYLEYLQNEIDILRELDRPNMMRFHKAYSERKFFYLVTECWGEGNYLIASC
jgi:serine/threonine protein kinase